jgi:hypothetical protein
VAGAQSAQGCSTTNTSFCASTVVTVTAPGTTTDQHHAAAPADLTMSFANTTTDRTSQDVWVNTVRLSAISLRGKVGYTPSRNLAGGLLLAGSTADCGAAPDFSACAGGRGSVDAIVTGGTSVDGAATGSFGVEKVVNVGRPATQNVLTWRLTLQVCLVTTLGCNGGTPRTQTLDIIASKADPAHLVLPTSFAFDFDAAGQPAHADVSMASLDGLHIRARSNMLNGGSTVSPAETVFHLPVVCGAAGFGSALLDRGGARVALPGAFMVNGCPTAVLSATEPAAYEVDLHGGASHANLSGRSVARYFWTFGDGESNDTKRSSTRHAYSSRDHTATLVVSDSAGALSRSDHVLLKGTHITVHGVAQAVSGQRINISGRMTRWNTTHGLGGRTLKVRKCAAQGSYCTLLLKVLTSDRVATRGNYSVSVTAEAGYRYEVRFDGGGGFIGSNALYFPSVS